MTGVAVLGLGCALPGVSWAAWNQPVPSPLNVDPTRGADAPNITVIGGTPYVSWEETNGTAYQIRVAQLTGGSWSAVGGSLNVDSTKNASDSQITSIGGTPYVTWSESNGTATQIRVARFAGGSWSAVGGSLNADPTRNAEAPSITSIGGTPYVAWDESNGTATQVRVAQFTGSSWSAVGGSLNVDPTKNADAASITIVGGAPYVAWRESNGTTNQVPANPGRRAGLGAAAVALPVKADDSAALHGAAKLRGAGRLPQR